MKGFTEKGSEGIENTEAKSLGSDESLH